MAEFKIYKLHFTSPLHINTTRDDNGYSLKSIQSDTLYAAIISCLAKIGVEIPESGDLGFTTSSLFPYYQEDKNRNATYFFPMPLSYKIPDLSDNSKLKDIKKVQWVDVDLYSKLISGVNNFVNTPEYIKNIHGAYVTDKLSNLKQNDFITSNVVQRVKIESRTGKKDALPYFVDRISFIDYSGLFFVVSGDTSMLDKGLNLLSTEGLGTDRNVGFGLFEINKDSINIDLPSNATHQLTLSMMIPESKEQLYTMMDDKGIAYDLNRRGGWITTHPNNSIRKNAIYAFTPGSIFKISNIKNNTIGKIVDLRPQIDLISHHIWRNGKSIMLPIII